MSTRPRHPMKSFIMFLVVCGLAGAAWANREKLRASTQEETPPAEVVQRLYDLIVDRFENEECFVGMRTNVLWRSNEGRFRLDITVVEGCDRQAKSLTADIARLILRNSDKPATVFAYDESNRELARHVL